MPDEKPRRDPDCGSGMFPSAAAEAERSLRARAQRQARASTPQVPADLTALGPEAAGKLFHELRVHQIELELQNEELRRSQEELEVSRARYFDLYDLAPVGYVTIDETGLVLEANLTAAALLDVGRSSLVQQPWTRFVHPEDQDVYYIFRKQLLSRGGQYGCELRLMKSNGAVFWAQIEARLSQRDDGTHASRITLSDTSERKRVQEALNASETRHRALFETSPAALLTLAPPSWKFTAGNGAALAMFGARDEAELLQRTPWDYSPQRQPDGQLSAEKGDAMLAAAMHAGSHSFQWVCLRSPAEEFRATIQLSRLGSGAMQLLQASVRDDSEVQRRQASVAETDRLASMGLLAASVGHEINNPLAYVLSNVQSLADSLPKISTTAERCRAALQSAVGETELAKVLGNEAAALEPAALQAVAEQAREALDGARRIARISKVLSVFSRVDTQELAEVDVHTAIESAITMAFNELRFNTKLVRNYESVPPVWASEGKLSQVFLNLLINAAHATDDEAAESNCITVRTWAAHGNVFAEVEDTGSGITPENLKRIFEPFFSTKALGRGSGLGLSICRNILSELHGEIRVESEVGQGARFIVRLPVRKRVADAPLAQSTDGPAVRGRVLVIDDEQGLRTVMKRLLFEHEVVTASSGSDAKSILANDQNFDVIVCDLMMPVVSGMDIHRWLVEHNPALAKRVVFVTGGAFGPVAGEYLNATGNTKIEKPFDNREFVLIVCDRIRDAKSDPPPALVRGETK